MWRAVMKGERVHCALEQETLAHVSEAVSCSKETPWRAEVTSLIFPVLGELAAMRRLVGFIKPRDRLDYVSGIQVAKNNQCLLPAY